MNNGNTQPIAEIDEGYTQADTGSEDETDPEDALVENCNKKYLKCSRHTSLT